MSTDEAARAKQSLQAALDDPWFRLAFAGYLRERSDDWRLRRIDDFSPVDLKTARRGIGLQGQISRRLFEDFSRQNPERLPPEALPALSSGTEVALYLPFAAFPKRVLLQFSTHDAAGSAVPLLTRLQGGRVSGSHVWLALEQVARAIGAEHTGSLEQRRLERRGAYLVAVALATVNPNDLQERLWRWDRRWSSNQDQPWLLNWVCGECNRFKEGLGDDFIAQLSDGALSAGIDLEELFPPGRPADLFISTTSGLLLLAVRDVLKVLADAVPLPDQRRELFGDSNDRLFEMLTREVIPGLSHFNRVLAALIAHRESAPESIAARALTELGATIVDWVGYLATTVAVDQPFLFKSTEVIPLPVARRGIGIWTQHNYRLSLGDAVATHVEVATGEPELELPRFLARAVRLESGQKCSTRDVFGSEYVDSLHVAHFYTSRRAVETRNHNGSVRLVIRYRVARSIVRGYAMLVTGLLAAAGGLGYAWTTAAFDFERLPTDWPALTAITAAFLTVPVWLMNMQHKRPLVHDKLRGFRALTYVAVLGLLVVPAVAVAKVAFKSEDESGPAAAAACSPLPSVQPFPRPEPPCE